MLDEQDDHDQVGLRRRGWPEQTTMAIRSLAAFAATRLRCLVRALVRAHRQLIANLGWHAAVLQYTNTHPNTVMNTNTDANKVRDTNIKVWEPV